MYLLDIIIITFVFNSNRFTKTRDMLSKELLHVSGSVCRTLTTFLKTWASSGATLFLPHTTLLKIVKTLRLLCICSIFLVVYIYFVTFLKPKVYYYDGMLL